MGSGRPIRPPAAPSGSRSGRRTALVAGGVVGVLALVGAGAWAAMSFFSTGAQPAEALPDSTIAYASIDLDPSGGQKIEALRTLRKFPAFKDEVGLDTDDDVRQRIFEEVEEECPGLDYGDDVEPWLGDRFAVAAVDTGGGTPAPVFVVQVRDEGGADAGLQKLEDCGGSDVGAWAIADGWALVGESQDVVDDIAADAADAPLSEDEDYTTWTDAAGDAGIASAYVAPEAGDLLAGNLDELDSGMIEPPPFAEALKDFRGLGATVRFDDGALELEVAADAGQQAALTASARGDDVLSTLPADTVAAFGFGLDDGWFGALVDQLAASYGDGTTADELMTELSEESGLDLPEDAETLAGESAAFAISPDFDPEEFFSSEGSDVPIGVKVQGDPEGIEGVLDKLRPQFVGPEATLLDSDTEGDTVAIGPNPDYRAKLLEDGDLGDSDVFQHVVRGADDAAAIFFVNFNTGGDWLGGAVDEDATAENLEPLEGIGASTWLDGDTSHALLRITTD